MAVTRVRIADTEAVALYYPIYPTGVRVAKVVTLNYGKWSRRKIGLDRDCKRQLEDSIWESISNAKRT